MSVPFRNTPVRSKCFRRRAVRERRHRGRYTRDRPHMLANEQTARPPTRYFDYVRKTISEKKKETRALRTDEYFFFIFFCFSVDRRLGRRGEGVENGVLCSSCVGQVVRARSSGIRLGYSIIIIRARERTSAVVRA